MQEKIRIGGEEFLVRTKRVRQKDLTSDCWPVQVWGLPYCSGFGDYEQMCEYLGTEDCGGYGIRKRILAGEFPVNGLPDVGG
ncbi:MAG: hypothetical protein ACFFDT_03415 [Candidatus Hodarchaeota archaeon]